MMSSEVSASDGVSDQDSDVGDEGRARSSKFVVRPNTKSATFIYKNTTSLYALRYLTGMW